MEAAAKETEPARMAGGVWLWLPDRQCCLRPTYAAAHHEMKPLASSLQPSHCKGTKRDRVVFRGDAFRGDATQADGVSRSLNESDIRKRSSSSQEVFSPKVKVRTPDTPSTGAFKRKKHAKAVTGLKFDASCDHDPATGKCLCVLSKP